uniref:Uncharacterized protein n=2 Tax=Oryza sativa subsp. japonica TaxID=39947 RepID=Q10J23_ORYSJ|nr:hypothetical protein [Oryza sativa Japonica Group]ABF96815.1 hypothetical protein LOC_Os03g32240 [Oryza sativa Japonica Group]
MVTAVASNGNRGSGCASLPPDPMGGEAAAFIDDSGNGHVLPSARSSGRGGGGGYNGRGEGGSPLLSSSPSADGSRGGEGRRHHVFNIVHWSFNVVFLMFLSVVMCSYNSL